MKEILLITGCHRSGTSFISNILSEITSFRHTKNLIKANFDNEKGFFEDKSFTNFNEKLLEQLNSCHLTSKIFEKKDYQEILNKKNLSKAYEIINKLFFENNKIILKDPRISNLIPFWIRVFSDLKINIKFVFVIRNPNKIIMSLIKRNKLNREYASLLYQSYVFNFFNNIKNKKVFWMDFDEISNGNIKDLKKIRKSSKFDEMIENKYKKIFTNKLIHHVKSEINDRDLKKIYTLLLIIKESKKESKEILSVFNNLKKVSINSAGVKFYYDNKIRLLKIINYHLSKENIEQKKHINNLEKIINKN